MINKYTTTPATHEKTFFFLYLWRPNEKEMEDDNNESKRDGQTTKHLHSTKNKGYTNGGYQLLRISMLNVVLARGRLFIHKILGGSPVV